MVKTYTLTLSIDQVSVIGNGLQYIQYMHSAPLIKEIEKQINEQMQLEETLKATQEGGSTLEEVNGE